MISAGNLQFNYDETDQPISISGSANGTYSYDAQFKRVKQQVNGNTIYSLTIRNRRYGTSVALLTV